MKKIAPTKVRKELMKMNADPASIDLIMNTLSMYNDLVERYLAGTIGRDVYLYYQVNGLLVKQLADIRKANKKAADDEDDTFTQLIEGMKQNVKS